MIDFGLPDDYLAGFNTRCRNGMFDPTQSDDWKMGWKNAQQHIRACNFDAYTCGVTNLPCCGCSLFCEHRKWPGSSVG